jgi:hypothetical protein
VVKLTDKEVLTLSEEVNHLLWTNDRPELPPDFQKLMEDAQTEILVPDKNMQCAAHAVVCAALMCQHNRQVVTRAGSAYIVDPKQPEPFGILRHYWITTADGLMDLSLHAPGFGNCRPVIYRNRNVVDLNWSVSNKDNRERTAAELERYRSSRAYGIVYWTENKQPVTSDQVEAVLQKCFEPANAKGIDLRFGHIVRHCINLISGGASLRALEQEEAWREVAMTKSRTL